MIGWKGRCFFTLCILAIMCCSSAVDEENEDAMKYQGDFKVEGKHDSYVKYNDREGSKLVLV